MRIGMRIFKLYIAWAAVMAITAGPSLIFSISIVIIQNVFGLGVAIGIFVFLIPLIVIGTIKLFDTIGDRVLSWAENEL